MRQPCICWDGLNEVRRISVRHCRVTFDIGNCHVEKRSQTRYRWSKSGRPERDSKWHVFFFNGSRCLYYGFCGSHLVWPLMWIPMFPRYMPPSSG